MVTITPLSGAGAARAYQESSDNYYSSEEGKDYGAWAGRGAQSFGLDGEKMDFDAFQKILEGKNPHSGEQIIKQGSGEQRPGIDFTFSPDKSFSLFACTSPEAKSWVEDVHGKATQDLIDLIEKQVQCRITTDGVAERVNTKNIVAACFNHYASRSVDGQPSPHIHTHVVVANMTQRADGQWRAIANESLMERSFFISMYENQLAWHAQRAPFANLPGLATRQVRPNGAIGKSLTTRLEGVNDELIRANSPRSNQIQERITSMREELAEQYPNKTFTDGELKQMANLDLREAKQTVSWHDLVEHAQANSLAMGSSLENLYHSVLQTRDHALSQGSGLEKAQDYIRVALQANIEQEAVFTKENVLATAGRLAGGACTHIEFDQAFSRLQAAGEILTIEGRFHTTREMYLLEREIISKVQAGNDQALPILSNNQAAKTLNHYQRENGLKMTLGQRDAYEYILTSTDRIMGVNGAAGTGKTTVLDAVFKQLEAQGYSVAAMAYTGKAAGEITEKTTIAASTIDSFLLQKQQPSGQQIWFVDEASMIGNRQLNQILERAENNSARVVLLGDRQQLQAISAGQPFNFLHARGALHSSEMVDIIRQNSDSYREMINDLHARDIERAMEQIDASGKLHQITDPEERIQAVTDEYLARNNPEQTLVVSHLNQDRNTINQKIRSALQEKGQLSNIEFNMTAKEPKNISPQEAFFAQSYTPGEHVFAHRPGIIGRAGAEGIITSIDQKNHTITVQDSRGSGHDVDLRRDGDKLSIYTEKQLDLSAGDRMVLLKNDRLVGVKNGMTGTIIELNQEKISLQLDSGKNLSFDLKNYNYFDHGYAVTVHKSQGQSTSHVIYHAPVSEQSLHDGMYRETYVGLSRGRDDFSIYTNSKEELEKAIALDTPKSQTFTMEEFSQEKSLSDEKNNGKNERHLAAHMDTKERAYTKEEVNDTDKNIGRTDEFAAKKDEEITSEKEPLRYNYFEHKDENFGLTNLEYFAYRKEENQQANRSSDERQNDDLPPQMAQVGEAYFDQKDNECQYEGGRQYPMGGDLDEDVHRTGSDSSNAYEP